MNKELPYYTKNTESNCVFGKKEILNKEFISLNITRLAY